MPKTTIHSSWSRQGCSLSPPSEKKRKGQTSRKRNSKQFETRILWSCVCIDPYAVISLPWTQADHRQCYCKNGGMTLQTLGCVDCHTPRCDHCIGYKEKVQVGLEGQEQALYTWEKDAALRSDAALHHLTTAEPDLLQPPALGDPTTTITCTTLEPDPTHDQAGFQEGPLSAAVPEHVTSQSLNKHGLQRQADILPSPITNHRRGSDLSYWSLNETTDVAPDPPHLDPSAYQQASAWSSSSPQGTDTINRINVNFNGCTAEGSNACNGSSSPTNAVPSSTSPSNRSAAPKQPRKRTSDKGSHSKLGGAKRAKASTNETPQARKEDKPFLACPFWKKDSIRHRDCFRGVKRIRDVKQHLRRSHVQPVFCPRCGMEFGDKDAELRIHMRAVEQCDNREFREPDGITALHQKALRSYSDRSADEAEQWYVIWDYLFPCGPNGQPPPTRPISPYVGEDLSEEMLSLREHFHREGYRSLANDPKFSDVAFSIDEESLHRWFDTFTESWLAQRRFSSQQPWGESPTTLSDSSTPAESALTGDTTSTGYQILDDNIMSLSGFPEDLDLENEFLGHEIDVTLDDFVAMPSVDNTTAQTFPSVPLLSSEHRIGHTTQVATLSPTLISH